MKIAICSIRHTLLFGVLSALMLANGPAQSTAVITLFAIGELGATGFLCSLIVRQFRRKSMADSVMAAVAGYTISHLGILTVMYLGLVGSPAPNAPAGQSTLLWMELTLRVGLVVVLTSSAFVWLKPVIRKFSMPWLRKFTATA
ncbi:MAG TPA: hypothetical protein VN325_31345 [Steroidobacteraceae bacterium]|nr:hypothetical protein [Steroidobacteraceae bacterium]